MLIYRKTNQPTNELTCYDFFPWHFLSDFSLSTVNQNLKNRILVVKFVILSMAPRKTFTLTAQQCLLTFKSWKKIIVWCHEFIKNIKNIRLYLWWVNVIYYSACRTGFLHVRNKMGYLHLQCSLATWYKVTFSTCLTPFICVCV